MSCRVTVEPLSANLEVTRWRFMGGGFYVEENTSATTWSGIGVVSGRVFADFKLNGVSTYNYADLTVSARTSGIWTPSYWASQLMFTPGQGAQNCSGSAKVLSLMGWTGSLSKAQQGICDGQRIEPVGNAGYTLGSGGGPNAGIWYISGTSFFVHSTSQVHPDVFPNSQGYTLTSSQQASLCGSALNLPPGSPVTINFYNYNANCAKVPGWGGFIQAIWDHEEQHFRQGETALQHPGNNIYVALESVVEASQSDAALQVSTTYSPIQQALASAGGVEPTGNWTTPFWIWMSNTIHEFVPVPSPNF